jgi:hypothetical protein
MFPKAKLDWAIFFVSRLLVKLSRVFFVEAGKFL